MQRMLMGNECIALGAVRAGAGLVSGYPGTPSTEVLETIARENPDGVYVEWSVNEKAAVEVAAGASFSGIRTLVTMKQVGLNACADPVVCLAYIGIKGGMVILAADDPGPISSQTEQDTRQFARFSKLPLFNPSTPEEAYEMIQDAYEFSEKYSTPVIFRPTTRICHGYASIDIEQRRKIPAAGSFEKDPRWAIFPRLSYLNHIELEKKLPLIGDDFSEYRFNRIYGSGRKGIAACGEGYAYAADELKISGQECRVLKLAAEFPFPEKLAKEFLTGLDEVLVVEELDPVLERELTYICGKYGLKTKIRGKLTGDMPFAGEYSASVVSRGMRNFFGLGVQEAAETEENLPVRPPVLCAGCPHRASFYAVKQASNDVKAVYSGDIGCYTLGNAQPLNMVDTCLCMGAGITMAQGLQRADPDCINFAFAGDSTFFHTGIPGIVNAVYNQTKIVVIILDNSTTAMTGYQPHPGTGINACGEIAGKISIPEVLKALGIKKILQADPLNLKESISAVKEAMAWDKISAVVFSSPCAALSKNKSAMTVSGKCTVCRKCIKELGCPALIYSGNAVFIDNALCSGCGLCAQMCPSDAVVKEMV